MVSSMCNYILRLKTSTFMGEKVWVLKMCSGREKARHGKGDKCTLHSSVAFLKGPSYESASRAFQNRSQNENPLYTSRIYK